MVCTETFVWYCLSFRHACILLCKTFAVDPLLSRNMARGMVSAPGSTQGRGPSNSRPCTWPSWHTWAMASSPCLATSETSWESWASRSATSPRNEKSRRWGNSVTTSIYVHCIETSTQAFNVFIQLFNCFSLISPIFLFLYVSMDFCIMLPRVKRNTKENMCWRPN